MIRSGRRDVMRDAGRVARWALVLLAATVAFLPEAPAAVKPRALAVLPFDASPLEREQQWIGQGVAEIVRLGLAQHPAFVQVDESRLRAERPDAWTETAVAQALRTLRADIVVFGRVGRSGADLVVEPRLVEARSAGGAAVALEPITVPEGEMLLRLLAPLPGVYARTLKVALTDTQAQPIEKAAQPTSSVRAFELYARARQAMSQRAGQDGLEQAADQLARAIELDPAFVVAQYTLGSVHHVLGNRWKANAQLRAAIQLDPSHPEPYKLLGDLFLTAPRRPYDQAIEAFEKAIQLRPFYAEAHAGLGDARAGKGDVDGAIAAYAKALAHNPLNPRVHVSLGKIYYAERNLYYESVSAYKKAIELDPRSAEAHMGLGEVYEDKGLYQEAADAYRRVIEIDARHTGAMYNLAIVYEKTDPREAIAQWERYIAVASQLPSEKDWVDVAHQHLRKLRNQLKK
jgi:tetratricopeptide (TPR) repeat protein/TolB-like protein